MIESNQLSAVHRAVQIAIKSNIITRMPYKRCGKPYANAHHKDYNKPLGVIFLCSRHHKLWHLRWKAKPLSEQNIKLSARQLYDMGLNQL